MILLSLTILFVCQAAEDTVTEKVINQSELEETEKKILESTMEEALREQDEQAILQAALQQNQEEEEARLLRGER